MNDYELLHYGILGMNWGVRRTPEQLARARREKGERKQKKITEKQDRLRADNETQKANIKSSSERRRAIASESMSAQIEKKNIDRKLFKDDFITDWGRRRTQDKSFKLNSRIKELEELDFKERASIASALEKMDINNRKISSLQDKYVKIGKKYLEDRD